MAIEIDNKKMWETAIRLYRQITGHSEAFDKALEGMGLCYKDGEIITIEPDVKWYVALNDYGHYDNTIFSAVPLFLKGERTTKENVFNMCKDIMGYEITEEEFNKNFRPATEEETTRKTLVEGYQVSVDFATKEPEQPKERKVSGVPKKMLDNLDDEEQMPVEEIRGNNGGISPNPEWTQKKQEWSKEDIEMIDWLIRCCEREHSDLCNDRYGHQEIVSDLKRDCRKKWDWLESLKGKVAHQKQWSEEQLREGLDKASAEWDRNASFSPIAMVMDGDRPTGTKQYVTSHADSFKAGVEWVINKLKALGKD